MEKTLRKKIIIWNTIFSMVISSFLPLGINISEAQATLPVNVVSAPSLEAAVIEAGTSNVVATTEQTAADEKQAAEEKAEKKYWETLKNSVFTAMKQSLSNFLNTLAYDVATWLASGAKGQTPMFNTDNWGDYLMNLADAAAGDFIEKVGKNWGSEFNLCNPSNISFKITIGLGLAETSRPSPPKCTFSQMVNNWESFVNNANFLDHFSATFDPRQNDIGIAFTLLDKFYTEQDLAEKIGTKTREEGRGWKAVTEKISGWLKTPASLVEARAADLSGEGVIEAWSNVGYGDIVVDAIQTFANTLAGKLFQRLFQEGLAALRGSSDDSSSSNLRRFPNLSSLFNQTPSLYEGQGGVQGFLNQAGSRLRFVDFLTSGQSEIRPYDVLTIFATCPDLSNPGPEECVLSPSFRLAIEREMPLREAIDQGFINGDAPFGIRSGTVYDGIPYRSILILRTHRVIPVTWEIAAEIIGRDADKNIVSLNDLINSYNNTQSPYYKLIDENWLLKMPQHLCRARGYGEKLLFDQVVGGVDLNNDGRFDGDNEIMPSRLVGRTEYCADYQSCIDHNDDGSCRYYGYCVEERRVWDLMAVSCSPEYNTCQTFQDRAGQMFSYLKNTLDFANCSADNAGCRWYCTDYSQASGVWTCLPSGNDVMSRCNNPNGCTLAWDYSINVGESVGTHASPANPILTTLTMSEPCSENSSWFDSGLCRIAVSCQADYGAVDCLVNYCNALPNSLPNGGFETGIQLSPDTQRYITENWYVTNPNHKNYFQRVSVGSGNFVYQGSNSLRFFDFGSAGNKVIRTETFSLEAGSYTILGYVLDRLNPGGGSVVVNVKNSVGTTLNSFSPTVKNSWQRRSVNFSLSGESNVYIEIVITGTQTSGVAWFDGFKVAEECIAEEIRLSFANPQVKSQSKLHLDSDAQSCPAGAVGCSAFIRTKENLGANLVPNGGFEIWTTSAETRGWNTSGTVQQDSENRLFGNYGLALGSGSIITSRSIAGMRVGSRYMLSFWARANGDVNDFNVSLVHTAISGSESSLLLSGPAPEIRDNWKRFTYQIDTPLTGTNFNIRLNNPVGSPETVFIDAVQIEAVGFNGMTTAFKEYGNSNLVYLKKPPIYLGCSGDYANDPPECFNYALYCRPNEVGCQSYRPTAGVFSVPGVVNQYDYCPAECVGYEAYYQSASYFESQESLEYFIPKNAKQCTAAQVGCTEFTNLDEVARGGEGREYYQYLRQCVKPSSSCSTYFSWQGSNETGYQLITYSLSANPNGSPRVSITNNDQKPEAWKINNCEGPEDLAGNPFCREFFDLNGNAHYEILLNTISCSNECVPFRKTDIGMGDTETSCNSTGGRWENQACIYDAIPGQGIRCSANAAGCREYRGNTGGNIFTALFDNFEVESLSSRWIGDITEESLQVGGHSLRSRSIGSVNKIETVLTPGNSLGELVSGSGTFILSFWAKSVAVGNVGLANLKLELCEGATCQEIGRVSPSSSDWNYFLIGPFDYSSSDNIKLVISSEIINSVSPRFYIDSFELKKVNNYAYVVRGSWNTPVSCDTNPFEDPAVVAPQFMLGCQEYRDASNVIHNLKSFSKLCRQEAVGCEALIDTHNSSSPFAQIFNQGDTVAQVDVPADSLVFMTNKKEVSCDANLKGCQALGLPNIEVKNGHDQITGYQTTYLINNPDRYSQILCGSNDVWCEEYRTENGLFYFKNPRDKTCEFRQIPGGLEKGWYVTGSLSEDPDCPTYQPPLGLKRPTAINNNPSVKDGYVGICPGGESGCSQFVDPVSDAAKNQLINGDFSQNLASGGYVGWNRNGAIYSQSIRLKINTAYTFGFSRKPVAKGGGNDQLSASNPPRFFVYCSSAGLKSFDNTLRIQPAGGGFPPSVTIDTAVYLNDNRQSINGFKLDEAKYSGTFTITSVGAANPTLACSVRVQNMDFNRVEEIFLRETQVEYSLSQTVDKLSCNGIVDPKIGCVMFNDRSQVNYNIGEDEISSLIFDANVSGPEVNNGIGVIDCRGNCNANSVLKVKPNRVCGSWLTCLSRVQGAASPNTPGLCLDIGLCSEIDSNGNCIRQEVLNQGLDRINKFPDPEMIKNLSGFFTPGLITENVLVDGLYSYAEMEQIGGATQIANGDFEQTVGSSNQPVGWQLANHDDAVGWRSYKFRTVSGIDSSSLIVGAPEGNSYLRLNGFYQAKSEEIDIERGQEYILSVWVNTLYLRDSGTDSPPKAQVCITSNGQSVVTGGYLCPISVPAGLDWHRRTVKISDTSSANSITITLKNFSALPSNNCDTFIPGKPGICRLSGFSAFDDVVVAPMLEVAPPAINPGENIEIIFVNDLSASMNWCLNDDTDLSTCGEKSRLDLLKETLSGTVDNPGVVRKLVGPAANPGFAGKIKVGLVGYRGTAPTIQSQPLTDDVTTLTNRINGYGASGGTPTWDGLIEAANLLNAGDPAARKIVILMSDGVPSGSSAPIDDTTNAANVLKNSGAIVYSVVMSSVGGSLVQNMSLWSSNNDNICDNNRFCYVTLAADDVSVMYNRIIDSLFSQLLVNRSCRMYPTSSSLSCRVSSDNVVHFGQYGYCLLHDPVNPKQCLQWWPVDQIKGSAPDELSGYSDRYPLYYCVEKGIKEVKFGGTNTLARFNSGRVADSNYGFLMDYDSGSAAQFIPFEVPPEYQVFFRWPYVKKVKFIGVMASLGTGNVGGAIFHATMYPRMVKIWSFGASPAGPILMAPFMIFKAPTLTQSEREDDNETGGPDTCKPLSGHTVVEYQDCAESCNHLLGNDNEAYYECLNDCREGHCETGSGTSCSGILSCIGAFFVNIWNDIKDLINDAVLWIVDLVASIPLIGSSMVFDPDKDYWGGWGVSFVTLAGYAVGVHLPYHTAVGLNTSGGVLGTIAGIVGDFIDFVAVGTFGTKIVTDLAGSGFPDPIPDIPGDIIGASWFLDSAGHRNAIGSAVIGNYRGEFHVQYCKKLVQVVTSAGSNKSWAGRVSEGSGYQVVYYNISDYNLLASDPILRTTGISYPYDKPFNYEEAMSLWEDDKQYYSSDFRPFGSLVPPNSALEPSQWDSRDNVEYRQPLYFEPPRTIFREPHQARMGQIHQVPTNDIANINNQPGLSQVFLRSYGVWNWDDSSVNKSAHRYILQQGEGWNLLNSWSDSMYCSDPVRLTGEICRIRPSVGNILINDNQDSGDFTGSRAITIKLSFTTNINVDQEPLRSYVVDWGDSTRTIVSGANLLSRISVENPYVLYHSYDYWKMRSTLPNCANASSIDCCDTTQCRAKIKIKLRDNWNGETCRAGFTNQQCADNESNKFIWVNSRVIIRP